MRKPSLFIVWLTVFIDLVGFGIVVPLIPIFAERFRASSLTISIILAGFSAFQFVFAPLWGRLSDRLGRRPIMLISTAGAMLSYVIFALGLELPDAGTALAVLVLSRCLAGAFGGNITVAQAYIADITPPASRSQRMGWIGMAFGLGFIFGPALGGLCLKHWGMAAPGWAAAMICAGNLALAFLLLPESRQPDSGRAPQRPHLAQWKHTLVTPGVGLLVVIFFLSTLCFSAFEVTLALLVCANFKIDIHDDAATAAVATYLFIYCGLISVFVQGGMIKGIVRRLGEPKVIALSLVLTAISLMLLPFIHGGDTLTWRVLTQAAGGPWWQLLGALALLAVGTSLTRPPLFGLLSNLTAPNEQGANIGVSQSAGSLARIIGQFGAPIILLKVSPYVLFLGSGFMLLWVAVIVLQRLVVFRPATASV
ncbi:MAG TPA: MFS transporter [Verrucomicrobiota bacterium]|nr:MFS transporter [Verrucomicrobiota bacterium]HNT15203.1 MFS transporter [Verrucomicrobiota bacterium]